MAQYITLEEAAQKLGIPTDEFKRRLKTEWTHVVPMRDGPTLRFRVGQIEELSRQLGAASDVGLPLAEPLPTPGSDDFKVPAATRTPADEPLVFDGSDDDIFSLTDEPAAGGRKGGKSSGDSDVRLEAPGRKPGRSGETVPTEELSLDAGPGSAVIKGGGGAKLTPPSSAKLSAPDGGKKLSGGLSSDGSKNLSGPGSSGDSSSEFELSLDADSDDFQLSLNADSSDEVDLGSSPVEAAGGSAAGKSGVNLRDPDDSGIPLEAKKPAAGKAPPADSDPDLDFELTLDPAAPASGGRLAGGPKSGGRVIPQTSDSDSEFELTLDGSSGSGSSLEAAALESAEANKGDIFETDFEIPPMAEDSGSEAVAVDSDTDLEVDEAVGSALDDVEAADETGSQVVEIEDDADAVTPVVELGEDDDAPASSPRLRPAAELAAAPAAVALKPAPWGIVPVLILFPTVVLTLLGGLMSFELLRGMTGYAQPRKPSAPLVRSLAENLLEAKLDGQ